MPSRDLFGGLRGQAVGEPAQGGVVAGAAIALPVVVGADARVEGSRFRRQRT